ncbi:MAG: HlyC/CorC family transporter [Chloroflexi bacterium]|nr:HlyC/CorC family transporter [Chloroflexota bacterium]
MVFVLLLIIANGLFSLSEIAVVSARKARLQSQAADGNINAQAALELAEEPESFLSTVQVGITLIGILAGAVGGETIANDLAPLLENVPIIGPYSATFSLVVVVGIITYLQLVIGELTPKQIGLNNAERIAMMIARPMQFLSKIAKPLVWLLTISTHGVIKLLRIKPPNDPLVTREEVQMMMVQGTEVGIFEPIKEEMVEQVFRLGDQRVNDLMTPRPEVIALDLERPINEITDRIIETGHSRYPIVRGDEDNIVGIVLARDLLAQSLAKEPVNLEAIMRPALIVPEGIPVLDVLDRFKADRSQIAIVIDEYGELQGLMTFNDMLEEVVGDVPEMGDPPEPEAITRADGSWLIDGLFPIDDFKELFKIKELPDESENYYQTLGGFVMTFLSRIPEAGDHFEWEQFKFEVVDMDWRRVDKVLVTPPQDKSDSAPSEPPQNTD